MDVASDNNDELATAIATGLVEAIVIDEAYVNILYGEIEGLLG